MITAKLVKELRDLTGVGMMKCKEALEATDGDIHRAIDYLNNKGVSTIKSLRPTNEGLVYSYVHGGKVGVMIELLCETDFVARNEEFEALAKNLCLHIVGACPVASGPLDIPPSIFDEPYVKDNSKTANDLIKESIKKMGENIVIGRSIKLALGV